MNILTGDQRFFLACAILALSLGFCIAFIIRSIWLKNPINPDSQRLYAIFIAFGVVGALSAAGFLGSGVISALVGAVVGFIGGSQWGKFNKTL